MSQSLDNSAGFHRANLSQRYLINKRPTFNRFKNSSTDQLPSLAYGYSSSKDPKHSSLTLIRSISPPMLNESRRSVNSILSGCKDYLQHYNIETTVTQPKSFLKLDAEVYKQRIRDQATCTVAKSLQNLEKYKPRILKAGY